MTIETHDATVLSTFLDAKVTPMTDPAFIKELSMDKLMSDMLELAKKQEHDRIDTQLDDNDPHVLEPSLSNENETAAVQPADDLLQSKTPERGLSRKNSTAFTATGQCWRNKKSDIFRDGGKPSLFAVTASARQPLCYRYRGCCIPTCG